jgi:ubiquinone biosynthesis protein COQ4
MATLTQVSPGNVRMIDDEWLVVRLFRGARALARLFRDPDDTEQVFVAGVNLGRHSILQVIERLHAVPSGQRLVAERRSIDSQSVDLEALAALPEGTLGHEYATFLRSRDLTPDLFQAPGNVRNAEVRYVVQRIRQTHDLWHVLTGYQTDVSGEVLLQAFAYAQLRVPLPFLIAFFGTLKVASRRPSFVKEALGAFRRGAATSFLLPEIWEEVWNVPVNELRARLGISPFTT